MKWGFLKKLFKPHRDHDSGLEEKENTTRRKIEVAMSILDSREEDIPPAAERRKRILHERLEAL